MEKKRLTNEKQMKTRKTVKHSEIHANATILKDVLRR
jgi:hypothetical protein